MDWTKQAEEMLNTWTETQKKLWDSFYESVPDFGKTPSEKLWDQTIATGKQALKNSMAAQADWLNTWVDYISNLEGVPPQALDSAKQYQEMSKRWSETQEHLWENWFDMLKKFDTSKMASGWAGVAQDPFKVWQESSQKVMESQADWMRSWMKAMGGQQDDK